VSDRPPLSDENAYSGSARPALAQQRPRDEAGADQHGEDHDDPRDELPGGLERVGEGVADERERRRPEQGAGGAVGQDAAQRDAGRAGNERGQRAQDADEPAEQDRLGAVALEELLGALALRVLTRRRPPWVSRKPRPNRRPRRK